MHARVTGLQPDATFQQCVEAATYMAKEHGWRCEVTREFEYQFQRERQRLSRDDLRDESVIVFLTALAQPAAAAGATEDEATHAVRGSEFLKLVVARSDFRLFSVPDTDPSSYLAVARAEYKRFLRSTGCTFAWMLVKQGSIPLGRLVFQLDSAKAPRTCQNFVYLCRGDLPDATVPGVGKVKLSYKQSRVFRVVANGWIQAGDIVEPRLGNGGCSIFGRHFPDETFEVPHDDEGVLGMANDGEHTNASSFYLTVAPSAWMNKRYVAFGRVVEGMHVLRALRDLKTMHNQAPVDDVVIDDCGEISTDP
jgi:peptidylprolyl isomerase